MHYLNNDLEKIKESKEGTDSSSSSDDSSVDFDPEKECPLA